MQFRIILAILVLCVACSDRVGNSELLQADAIMESAPDSAMSILANVDTAALSQFDKAYYSLLYSQAQIKTWVILDSDSLFRTAYDAFRDHPDDDLRRRAYFYNAQIAFNRGDMQSAMSDILNAYEIAKSEHNPYWTAKSAEIMGDIFTKTYNYPQAERYTSEAAQKYKEAGKILNHRYALCDLARVYCNENLLDKGVNLIDSMRHLVINDTPVDSALMGYIMDSALPLYFLKNRHDDILYAYEHFFIDFYGKEGSAVCSAYMSSIYQDRDELPKSINMLYEAFNHSQNEQEQGFVLYTKYCNAVRSGDNRLAASLCDSLLYYESRIVERVAKESVTVVQRDFYNKKAEQEKKKARTMTMRLIVAAVVVLVIILLLIIIFRLKIRTKNAEIESKVSEFLNLKNNIDSITLENRRLTNEILLSSDAMMNLQQQIDTKSQDVVKHAMMVEELFRDKWNTFNKLCNDYFEMVESGIKTDKIIKDIENELKSLSKPKTIEELEKSIDIYLGGIMTKLRTEIPDLKEREFVFLSLIFAGFSVRAICLITDIKYKNFYLIKSRLVRRITNSDAEHKELFLQMLRK